MCRLLPRLVGVIVIVAIAAPVALLVELYPWHPTTVWGWLTLVALALPIMVVGELVGKAIFENRLVRLR